MSSFTPLHGGLLQRKCACGGAPGPIGECELCHEKRLQRKTRNSELETRDDSSVPPIVHEVLRSPGQPLDPATRAFMEPRFGHNFSQVRVHTDARAAESAAAVNALAYTVGQDLVFGVGQYEPGTSAGRRLMAHELAHVAQSGLHTDGIHQVTISPPGNELEIEADQVADRIDRGERLSTRIKRHSLGSGMKPLHRKVECSLKHIEDECNKAASTCAGVAAECSTRFPDTKALDAQYAKATKEAKDKTKYPNASKNLLHFLDGSGTEMVMPVAAFEKHPETLKRLLEEHREKFLAGAKKRLESGALVPAGTAEMVWTGTANAFSYIDDLAIAVGGYTLCSKVQVKAEEIAAGRFKVMFLDWSVQAFDCYNWDPGKGIGVVGFDDTAQCCLENAGKAKHFRIRTDEWSNTDAASTKEGEVSATLHAAPAASGSAPPPSTSPGIGEKIRKFFLER